MKKPKETPGNQSPVSLSDEGHLLRILIDNIPDFIYVKDLKSRFVIANRKLAQVHHLKSTDEIIGKTDHDLYPAELADKYYSDEQEIQQTGKSMINRKEVTIDEEGIEIHLSTTKVPLKGKDGTVIGLVGIGRDITHLIRAEEILLERSRELESVNTLLEEKQEEIQQQSEELVAQKEHLTVANLELEKLSVAVSETDNVVIILDPEGNLEWVNKSFTHIYGMTLDKWIEKRGRNIITGSFHPYIADILDRCKHIVEPVRYQTEARNKDGESIWTQSTLSPVVDSNGNIVRLVIIDSDISALKKAQDLINEQREVLEKQNDELEKLNTTKDKFFSIIAHDLKNPFHAILGFSDILNRDFDAIEDVKKQEFLRLIYDSARFAQGLLDNLLQWSRSQSGTIQYKPDMMELHPMAEEIRGILGMNLEEKRLQFHNDIPPECMVYADSNMIHAVMRNLVSNAVKYTPENGSITVEAKEDAGRIEISIRDTGIGISEEARKKILRFDDFYSTAGTSGEQGTGLGLIICNEFIMKHGGELKLESTPGKGTTWSFSMPGEKTD